MKLRAVIVTDNSFTASALGRALRGTGAVEVVGWTSGPRQGGGEFGAVAPDIVLIDDGGCRGAALDHTAAARRAAPDAKIVLLATDMDPGWLVRANSAGADAVVRRTADALRIAGQVRDVLAGNVYHAFAPSIASEPAAGGGLTGRELEILRHVAAGESNSAIAARLWITEQTVKFHLSNVYRKLGVANRTQASRYAYLHGLMDQTAERLHASAAA